MKVYIVTRGGYEYSDYKIVAVFLSRQEAELYIATHNNDDEFALIEPFNEIEEYETQDGNIHVKEDNPIGYIYCGYYTSDYHVDADGNKHLKKYEFIVDKKYVIGFKNTKLSKMQVWLPQPDYDKAKRIIRYRHKKEQAELNGLI